MTDYKQTRDAAGNITSQYGQMLRNLDDDLVERLRSVSANPIYILGKPGTTQGNVIANEAADRIEELEAKLAKVVTELRKLGEAAKENAYGPYHIVCHGCSDTHHAVDAALTELTGGKP